MVAIYIYIYIYIYVCVSVCTYTHYLVAHSESPHHSNLVALFHIVDAIDSHYSLNRRKCLVIVMDIDCVFYEVGTDIVCGRI